jgi:subtilisin family serine protease
MVSEKMQTKLTVKVFSSLLILGLIFSILNTAAPTVAKPIDEQSLEKVESRVLNAVLTDGTSSFVIEIAEKADLSKAYTLTDWSERGWYVYNTLREVAERTQKPILEILKKRGLNYESFFAANEIAVQGGNFNTLSEIAALPAVGHIRFPRIIYLESNFISIHKTTVTQATINSLAWGITDTNADDFWSEFGLQGDGLIVANIDTGVQWDHPALDQAYKCGTDSSNPACWADPANICGGSACDNNGHGTHTMGTMVGDDDPTLAYQVGMAPNAQWIACKGCETDECSEASLNACADWIIAPAGDPANRPHIVNNSWGGVGGNNWYLAKVEAWRAAGIFPAFSAGNSGPSCGSLGSPGDYQESFATANHMDTRVISSTSSRGPSTFGDNPYTKPNISAPGTGINSSFLGGGYTSISGTSMASPHVAGAVALLWSCNPSLIGNISTTFELLQDTADSPTDEGNCGAPTDGKGNFTYGYGYLNVFAAGLQVCPTGDLYGTVTDGTTPVEGATVTAENGTGLSLNTLTNADGAYTLHLPEGSYTVTASKYGYSEAIETEIEVHVDGSTKLDFIIYPMLSVIPTELEQTQFTNSVSNQSFTIVNPSASEIDFELLELPEDSLPLENVELFLETGDDIPWISLDPITGTVPAGEILVITVTYDSSDLAVADYLGSIQINHAPAPPINLPVTLHVINIPKLYLPWISK